MNSAHIFRAIKNDSQLHTHKHPPSRGQNGKQTFSSLRVMAPPLPPEQIDCHQWAFLQAAAAGREWQIDRARRVNTNAFRGVTWGWNYTQIYTAMAVRKRIGKCNNKILTNETFSRVINYRTCKCREVCGWAPDRIQCYNRYATYIIINIYLPINRIMIQQ